MKKDEYHLQMPNQVAILMTIIH